MSRHDRLAWLATVLVLGLMLFLSIGLDPQPRSATSTHRRIETEELDRYIREGRVSDKPARYWRSLEEAP